MAARQQREAGEPLAPAYATATVNGAGEPPTPVDPCTYTEGSVDLLFDPNRVLLRRLFFLNPEKTKYISVGFYPGRNYQPLVEIGSPKSTLIILTDQHVKTISQPRSTLCGEANLTMFRTVTWQCTRLPLTTPPY
jgi:hypothetical protein